MPHFRYPRARTPFCLRAILVAVPETPVHEDRPALRSIRKVRGPWQIFIPQTVLTTQSCDQSSHIKLRTRVGLFDRLHHTRASGWRNNVPWAYQRNSLVRWTSALLLLPCFLNRLDEVVLVRSRGHPVCTGLSTNASCQPEKPESSQPKRRGAASTLGVELAPHETSLPTRENARSTKTCGMWRIPGKTATGAAVNKTGG